MEVDVWIIDDDLVSQFATRYTVERSSNIGVVSCYDCAEDAMEMLMLRMENGVNTPLVILLDLVMPKMSGWEFLDQTEVLSVGNPINVYILSAFSKAKDRDRAKKHTLIQGYFDKPLSRVSADKIFNT